jgi:hypothetical protein
MQVYGIDRLLGKYQTIGSNVTLEVSRISARLMERKSANLIFAFETDSLNDSVRDFFDAHFFILTN